MARFIVLYLGFAAVLWMLLAHFQDLVVLFYVKPLSVAASLLLQWIGVESAVATYLEGGFCVLWLGSAACKITQACTGLFTCTLFACGVLSFPVAMSRKLAGLLMGVPALFAFGVVRVSILAVVADTHPSQLGFFHDYVMSIAGVTFAMFVWIAWFHWIVEGRERDSTSW